MQMNCRPHTYCKLMILPCAQLTMNALGFHSGIFDKRDCFKVAIQGVKSSWAKQDVIMNATRMRLYHSSNTIKVYSSKYIIQRNTNVKYALKH